MVLFFIGLSEKVVTTGDKGYLCRERVAVDINGQEKERCSL